MEWLELQGIPVIFLSFLRWEHWLLGSSETPLNGHHTCLAVVRTRGAAGLGLPSTSQTASDSNKVAITQACLEGSGGTDLSRRYGDKVIGFLRGFLQNIALSMKDNSSGHTVSRGVRARLQSQCLSPCAHCWINIAPEDQPLAGLRKALRSCFAFGVSMVRFVILPVRGVGTPLCGQSPVESAWLQLLMCQESRKQGFHTSGYESKSLPKVWSGHHAKNNLTGGAVVLGRNNRQCFLQCLFLVCNIWFKFQNCKNVDHEKEGSLQLLTSGFQLFFPGQHLWPGSQTCSMPIWALLFLYTNGNVFHVWFCPLLLLFSLNLFQSLLRVELLCSFNHWITTNICSTWFSFSIVLLLSGCWEFTWLKLGFSRGWREGKDIRRSCTQIYWTLRD